MIVVIIRDLWLSINSARKDGILILLRDAQTDGEIVGANEQRVDIRHVQNFIQPGNGGDTFNIDDHEFVRRITTEIRRQCLVQRFCA